MNELLNMVVQFNTDHQDQNVFAFFDYTGHTQAVLVRVDRTTEERYGDPDKVEQLYSQYCYTNEEYGPQKDIEALTDHFSQWVAEFEQEQAA